MRLNCFELQTWLAHHTVDRGLFHHKQALRSEYRYRREGRAYDTGRMKPLTCDIVGDQAPTVQETLYRHSNGRLFVEQNLPLFSSFEAYFKQIFGPYQVDRLALAAALFALYPFTSPFVTVMTVPDLLFNAMAVSLVIEPLVVLGLFPLGELINKLALSQSLIDDQGTIDHEFRSLKNARRAGGWSHEELTPVVRRDRIAWVPDNLTHFYSSPHYPETIYRTSDGRYVHDRQLPFGRRVVRIFEREDLIDTLESEGQSELVVELDRLDEPSALESPTILP